MSDLDSHWVRWMGEDYKEGLPVKSKSALDKQVGGSHYKEQGIQPVEYIHANKLNFFEGNAVKYITRHRTKGGVADLEKAIHYIELIIELEYGKNTNTSGT